MNINDENPFSRRQIVGIGGGLAVAGAAPAFAGPGAFRATGAADPGQPAELAGIYVQLAAGGRQLRHRTGLWRRWRLRTALNNGAHSARTRSKPNAL